MNIYFILFLFYQFYLISTLNLKEKIFLNNLNNFLNNNHNKNNVFSEGEINSTTINTLLIHTFQTYMNLAGKDWDDYPLDEIYQKILMSIFMEKNVDNSIRYFYVKTLGDSTKNKNDIQKYQSCMYETFGYNLSETFTNEIFVQQPLFYIIYIDTSYKDSITSVSYRASEYMFGLCFPKISYPLFTFEEEKIWAEQNFRNLTIIFSYNFGNLFHLNLSDALNQVEIITVYNKTLQNKYFNLRENKYLNLIPFIIIVFIIILISCIRIFPFFLVKKFFIRKQRSATIFQTQKNKTIYNKTKFNEYKKLLGVSHNIDELFSSKLGDSNLFYDSGLVYIKGIRGISLIFFIFGCLFYVLYNNSMCVYEKNSFIYIYKHGFYFIFFAGIRYAPRVLFSCSGYTLFYKFYCYLEEKKEENENKKNMNKKDINNDNFSKRNIVPCKYLFHFILRQIHKYLLFILVIFFMRYSVYEVTFILNRLINYNGPMWEFFRTKIVNSSKTKIFLGVLNMFSFYPIKEREFDFLIYLWPVYNEIFFFVLTTIIIFISYNKKFRMDILFKFLIFFLMIVKLLISFFTNYHSTLYYLRYNFGIIFTNPIYNYNYFLIGVYFGMNNYIIQKNLADNDLNKYNKPYFISSFDSVKNYKNLITKIKKFIFYIIFSFFIIFVFSFSNFIIINILNKIKNQSTEDIINNFISSNYVKTFYCFDIEIIVYLCNSLAFLFYIKGDNGISNLLSLDFWNFLNKMYFNFILLINIVILYILYQSEIRIILNLFNCILYSIICAFITFFFVFISSIFFELPAKRIINFIKERNSENFYEDDEDDLIE